MEQVPADLLANSSEKAREYYQSSLDYPRKLSFCRIKYWGTYGRILPLEPILPDGYGC
jgi:hypothetical protein